MKRITKILTSFLFTSAVAVAFCGAAMAATEPPPDPNEPNNDAQHATAVEFGKAYKGEIGAFKNWNFHDDEDWFKFKATKGKYYVVKLEGWAKKFEQTTLMVHRFNPGSSTDTFGKFGDEDVNFVTKGDRLDEYEFQAEKSGTYYFRLHNFFDNDDQLLHNDTGYVFSVKELSAKVTLSADKKEVVCGKTTGLQATVKGSNDKVVWHSSNTKIATVDSNGKIKAKMAGRVIISASCGGSTARCEVTVLYKDVTKGDDFWYDPTNYLTGIGVVKGYDNQTKFKPANQCTRAQMVTFIWRLMKEPAPKSKTCKFKDVKKTDYYYKAVIWANENHIVEGYKDGTFGPQIVCARKHAVTFLWRLAGEPKPYTKENKFKDVKTTDYFYTATIWAAEQHILSGYDDGTFRPNGNCLRRQMVTFLYKYDGYILGNWMKQIFD